MKICYLLGLTLILCVGLVSALPLTINEVQIDDIALTSGTNRVSLDRNASYPVEIQFTPQQNINNLEIEAFISGYEYNYDDKISDATPADDYEANTTYKRTLNIKIPKDVEEDSYKLRILFSDRDGDSLIQDYNLKLDPVRNALEIIDIILSQETVEAGNTLTASVRLANLGSEEEEDIKIGFTIPELGINAATYLDELEQEDEESSEEVFLRIPDDAKAGVYNLDVKVDYDRKHSSVYGSVLISVKNPKEESASKPKIAILIGSQLESASFDKPAVYPVLVTNYAKTAKVFTFAVEGADFADVEVNPAGTFIVQPDETAQIAIVVTPNKGLSAGTRVLSLDIIGDDRSIKQVPLTLNILKTEASLLPYILAVSVIAVATAFCVFGFGKINKIFQNKKGEKEKIDSYY